MENKIYPMIVNSAVLNTDMKSHLKKLSPTSKFYYLIKFCNDIIKLKTFNSKIKNGREGKEIDLRNVKTISHELYDTFKEKYIQVFRNQCEKWKKIYWQKIKLRKL